MIAQGTKVGAAYIAITAQTDKFRQGMADMEAQAKRATAGVRSEIDKTDSKIRGMTGSVGMLTQAMAAIGGFAAAGQLVRIADSFTQMRGRLGLVVKEGENLLDVEEKLYQLAIKNRAALEPTVALYSRLRSARSDLTDAQALKIVDTWNKTLVITGANAGGAAAATIQLSQAMAGGVLRAEEFNSITENNIRAVQLFASSLGVGMGELRAMVNDGKVGFDELVKAMTEDAGDIGDEFNSMSMTVGQALTNLQTAMVRFVGLQDQQFEGSKKLAEWVGILADNFEILATAILVAGASVAVALGYGVLFGLVNSMMALAKALTVAGGAAKAFGLAMAWLGGPWGIVLGAAAAALGSIAFSFIDIRSEAEKADDRLREFEASLKANENIIKQWEVAQAADELKGLGDAAKAAAVDVDALNTSLLRNEKQMKVDTLTLQARVASMDAIPMQRELDFLKSPKWVSDELGGRQSDQTVGNAQQIKAMEDRIARQKGMVDALLAQANALASIPLGFGDVAAKPKKEEKKKAIAELTGYYSDLEKLERSLADIRDAEAKGATGASRAAVQAMLDYLEATGDVLTVLQRMKDLSGGILSAGDAALIDKFVDASIFASVAETARGLAAPSSNDLPTYTFAGEQAWASFEQRVAEATKYGLMTAIETGEWGDAFGQILTDVTREALSNAIDVLWEALAAIEWDGKSKGWGGFLNMAGAAIGGSFKSRAGGGPVNAGDMSASARWAPSGSSRAAMGTSFRMPGFRNRCRPACRSAWAAHRS